MLPHLPGGWLADCPPDPTALSRLQEAESYASDNGIFFMETSAKTATNVNELFVAIGMLLRLLHCLRCLAIS